MEAVAITVKDVLTLTSVLGSALSLGWWLRSQLDQVSQRLAKIETQLEHWETQSGQFVVADKEAREGRSMLHDRVNDIRDRVLRLEVKNKMTVGSK
jgi:hypothetical protein